MVERCPDKTEVDGSIPSTLTRSFINICDIILYMKKIIFIILAVIVLIAVFYPKKFSYQTAGGLPPGTNVASLNLPKYTCFLVSKNLMLE